MVYLSRRVATMAAHYHLRRGLCARFEVKPVTVRNDDKTVDIGFKVATFDKWGRFIGNLSSWPSSDRRSTCDTTKRGQHATTA